MNQFKLILSQFRELFVRMTGAQRLSIVLFGGAVLIFLAIFIVRATSYKQDQVLFWSVEPAQAGKITDKLKTIGVEHRYEGGAILMAPTADRGKVMMALAQDGLLPADLQFDFGKLIEKTSFSLTRDERDRNYDIALATELAKIIRGIDCIEDARVIVPPEEPNPLLQSHIERKASVNVTVKGKRTLARSEVEAIANLVASAVRGLDAKNVKISDSRGHPYSYSDEIDASDKFMLKKTLEAGYKEKIEECLLAMMPKAVAAVEVEVEMQKRRIEKKDYNDSTLNKGAMAVLTSAEQEKETSKSKEGSQGVVGAGVNAQAEIKQGDGGTQMDTSKSRKAEKFDNSVVQEFIEDDPADAKIKGVAVIVVDKRYAVSPAPDAKGAAAGPLIEQYNWLDETKNGRSSLQSLVAKIVGVEEALVTVTQQAMILDAPPDKPSALASFIGGLDGMLIAMLALALSAVWLLMRMIRKAQPEEDIMPMPEYEKAEKEDLEPLEEPHADPRIVQVEKRIKELVEEDAAKAAGQIKHWMSE